MNRKDLFCYSFIIIAASVSGAYAGIRVGNLSRSNAAGYQQVNETRYQADQATQAAAATVQSASVADGALVSNSQTNSVQMDRCSLIYPNGDFAWARPTVGRGIGGASTCTAVVELRAIGAGLNGSDAVLARANLAAGDSIRCNISDFPDITHLPQETEIIVPADREPTMDDVIAVMNQEQKQHAGLKIAAGAVLGGLGGNVAGKNEPGKDGLLGGGQAKTKSTVIGALGGAALMAGNVYTGKVAGDMILSTGVNAAAGAVMGNMVASGDSVMRIEPCTVDGVETTCLWGFVEKTNVLAVGETAYVSVDNINNFRVCTQAPDDPGREICSSADLTNVKIEQYDGQKNRTLGGDIDMDLADMFAEGFEKVTERYCYLNNKMDISDGNCQQFVKLTSASRVSKRIAAMLVGVTDKATGWKRSDWADLKKTYGSATIVGRIGSGQASNLPEIADINSFRPAYVDASDGGVIDMSNKARLKGTLTGAGVGGAMGAFAGYQGAQSDIEERWVSAVREYKDSLGKVYCATGTRFLSQYNDTIIIPAMTTE